MFVHEDIIKLCTKLELIARPEGFHVGWTGSTLYGQGSNNDLDLIVYPHKSYKKTKMQGELCIRDMFKGQKVESLADKEYQRQVYRTHINGIQIDILYLE